MTHLVEQLTQGIDRIVTVSAAAKFDHHTASMSLPPTVRSEKSIGLLIVSIILLIVSIMGMTKVDQSIKIVNMMIHGLQSDMVATEESAAASQTVARPSTPLSIIGRELTTFKGLKRTSDITSTHTATLLIKVRRVVDLIVIGRTEKKFGLGRAVSEAVSALLQGGCAAPTASVPTATDLMSSMQSTLIREAELPVRESNSKVTVPIAGVGLRIGLGLVKRLKMRIFAMCGTG